jgi:hypothetical protein
MEITKKDAMPGKAGAHAPGRGPRPGSRAGGASRTARGAGCRKVNMMLEIFLVYIYMREL